MEQFVEVEEGGAEMDPGQLGAFGIGTRWGKTALFREHPEGRVGFGWRWGALENDLESAPDLA